MKKILIIGASILQVPAIIEAKKMGIHVVTFDYDKTAPGFKIADEAYEISTIDINQAVLKAQEINPDGVITLASDMPIRTVAAIGKALNINSISEETAYKATNKCRMRESLKEHKVQIPEFYIVDSKNRFDEVVHNFKDKQFIVKPADSSGSRGIYLCDKSSDLDSIYSYSNGYSISGEIIIEEYMKGKEVSVETFTIDGEVNVIAITDKITTGSPYFVELGHSQPSHLSISVQEEISEVAISAVKALGIDSGPSHVEIILTEEGPKIVELGARLGGDNIANYLVPLSTGVNIVEACIKLSLGKSPNINIKRNRGAAIRYFESSIGRIKSIKGMEFDWKEYGVKEFKLLKGVGDLTSNLQNSNDRIGYVICDGETVNDAIKRCEYIKDNIVFEIENI